jgi:hypothetical protein
MLTYSLLFCYLVCLFISYKAGKYYEQVENELRKKQLEEAELTIDDFINQMTYLFPSIDKWEMTSL